MSDLWFPRAVKDGRAWTNYALNGSGGSKRVAVHTTENSQSSTAKGVANYMWSNAGPSTGYSILYHPTSGEFLQLRPFNVGAGSLKNLSGGVETNKNGALNFQLSVVAYASEPWWSKYPLPNWQEFINWVRSWGIPDQYVQYNYTQKTRMSNSTWTSGASGWYGHAHAPENDHTDPGGMPDPWNIAGGVSTGGGGGGAAWESYDSNGNFHRNLYRKSPGFNGADVKWVQQAVGTGADGLFGDGTASAVKSWQSKNGLTADGNVGPQTAAALGMPGAGSTPAPPSSGGLGTYPLAEGHHYGPKSDKDYNHSGYCPGEPSSTKGWGGSGGRKQCELDNDNIKRIQQSVGTSADGLYGNKTADAVKSVQTSHGLTADGITGPQTWAVL